MLNIIKILLVMFLTSCAGYKFQTGENPFSQYQVNSLSVPMFYNHSNFSNISGFFTNEIYQTLAGFKGLKVVSGNLPADATLIGIITSKDSVKESRISGGLRNSSSIVGANLIESRNDFFIPTTNTLKVNLKIIVIKHPTEEEIKFLQTNFAAQPLLSSKVIFNEVIPVTASFTREAYSDKGMQVNSTQNVGAQAKTIEKMAQNAATNFRDMILYAF